MQKLLIMAYMGTGKTELESRYENVVDFDFQDYKYIYDESIRHLPLEQRKGSVNLRIENSDYPTNFLNDAIKLLNEEKIVISPFIDHVFRAYDSSSFKSKVNDVRIILVCPTSNNFDEYVERFKQRGNSDEFIARIKKEFPSLIELFENASNYERIVMKPGQFLSDALEEYGIDLDLKSQIIKNIEVQVNNEKMY